MAAQDVLLTSVSLHMFPSPPIITIISFRKKQNGSHEHVSGQTSRLLSPNRGGPCTPASQSNSGPGSLQQEPSQTGVALRVAIVGSAGPLLPALGILCTYG